ncbi:acyltransferase [Candidatus Gracilibacteria bacterium]|nr:acyltransferase [Candidatus Gracilibacteria bacterium]
MGKVLSFINDKACKYSVTYGKDVRFYKNSVVHNISQVKKNILLSDSVHIKGELLIFGYGGSINIGRYSYVGIDSRIWSGEKIVIGTNVLISHQVNIIDSNSHELDHVEREINYKKLINRGHPTDKGSILTSPIIIEDNVWISFGATILKGVTIGKGAIIAAGSVVTKDVAPFTVVAGNPAEFVKKLKK